MSTSAILPISSPDFGAASATASQQTVFSNLLNQLQQAVGSGDLTNTATLLNAINAISPSSASSNTPLGTFLTNLGAALNDGSASEAQSALTTYQSATPASTVSATTTTPSATPQQTLASVESQLIQSENQALLSAAFQGLSSSSQSSSSSSSNSLDSLYSLLNEAYGTGSSSNSSSSTSASSSTSGTDSTSSSTPYDALVSSVQASLAGANGALTPALAYLQASGNFVNTSA